MNLTDLQLSFIHNLLYNKEWVYNEEKESLKLTTSIFIKSRESQPAGF